MKLQSLKLAALAIAGLAAFSPSVKAQSVTTSVGDLILAVYQTNSADQGYGNTYEVDLGSLTNFSSTVSNYDLNGKVSISDLDAIFNGGSSAFSSTGLSQTSWLVVATQGTGTLSLNTPSPTTPNTSAVLITDTAAAAPLGSDASGNTLAVPSGDIGGLQGGLNNVAAYNNGTSNMSSAAEFAETTPSDGPGFGLTSDITTQNGFSGTSEFYLLNPAAGGSRNGAQDGTVTPLGNFQFVSGTDFTYNAVPEPSTYALMGLGALLLVITARRRMASNS